MIYLYSGTPGSGKSLHQAEKIYYRLRMGHPVIANYAINVAAIKHYRGKFIELDNTELKPQRLIDFAKEYFKERKFSEGAIWLFIDEAQLMFNAREWSATGREEWIAFFTQHRKYGYDIFLVAQFDRMLDRQLRSLIEYEVIHRKVSNFGVKGWIFSMLAGGNLFVAVKMWYPMKERVGSEFFKYHKKYQRLYDSYKEFAKDNQIKKNGRILGQKVQAAGTKKREVLQKKLLEEGADRTRKADAAVS